MYKSEGNEVIDLRWCKEVMCRARTRGGEIKMYKKERVIKDFSIRGKDEYRQTHNRVYKLMK
jgi:hypothetical protein